MLRGAMNWGNERWVKLYTRDSPSWCLLSWKARGLMCLLMRAVDRDGVIDLGESEPGDHRDAMAALAALLRMPVDDLREPLGELAASRAVTAVTSRVTLPKFREAQDTPTSDAERQRKSRERKLLESVELSRAVTPGHVASPTEQNRTEQNRLEEKKKTPAASPPVSAEVQEIFGYWRAKTGVGPGAPGKAQAAHIRARLTEGWSVSDLKAVVDGAVEDIKRWPERANYIGVDTLYRSADQVTKFVRLAPNRQAAQPNSNGHG